MKTIRMPKAHLDAWLHALRTSTINGKPIKQANGVMRKGNAYCCLGVLQKVVGGRIYRHCDEELPAPAWLDKHGVVFMGVTGCQWNNPYLPAIGQSAATLNDAGASFAEIADLIEKHAEAT